MTLHSLDSELNFCSIISNDAGEQLFGTAPETTVWLLIPYPTPWGAKAFEESELPMQFKEKLTKQFQKVANSKILLIRPRNSIDSAISSVYLAFSYESHSALFSLPISRFEDLLEYNLMELNSGHAPNGAVAEFHSIYLVCTNGRRDVCCSKWGLPVFKFLEKTKGVLALECSHLGGHRFAANLIILPEGLYYGRVNIENVSKILAAHHRNEVYLNNYRGRSCYPQVAQAAEYYLHQEIRPNGYHLNKIFHTGTDQHTVVFSTENTEYAVTISVYKSSFTIIENCAKPNDHIYRYQFSLDGIIEKAL